MALGTGAVLLVVFFLLLAIGTPIAISIGISGVATLALTFPFYETVFTTVQKMFTGLDSFNLLALPFFVLSGVIMNNGGIAIRLVNFAQLLSGRLPGSLAHTNIVGNMLFGSISGSSVAAAAAIGGTLAPLEEKQGYDRAYSAAVNIISSPAGLLIPPSGQLILYSLVSGGTSVGALFLAGYIPGILWGLGAMVVAYFIAKKNKYPVSDKMTFKQGIKVTIDAIPSLLLIVIVIGGIVGGIFTATEGSAIAVVYSIALAICYKSFNIKEFPKMLLETVEMSSIIMFLIATSSLLSIVMSLTGIPQAVSSLIGTTTNPIMILLLINFILLVVGTFMDIAPAVLIFTPIFLPIVQKIGIHPVHFGILMTTNFCMGNVTPPVGSALFVGCSVARLKIEDVFKPLLPFFVAEIIVLLIVTFVPGLSLFLPRFFKLI